jgi:nucleoid-associated protein YgaU
MLKEIDMTQQPGTIATCATYIVQPGDSLSLIAMKAYGDVTKWQWIYDYNKEVIGDNPDLLQPGQRLFIPHSDPITQYANYIVQTSDTLQSIAERAYCDAKYWDVIWWANQRVIGRNPDDIQPGQDLFIPYIPGHGGGHTT